MAKIDARRLQGFLAAPPATTRVVLLYGEDQGLVRERADILIKAVIGDAYRETERLVLDAVMRRFALPAPMTKLAQDLAKRADRAAAYHEATALAGFEPGEAQQFFGAPLPLDAQARALLEPWPVGLTLPACEKHGVKVMTRVVDHGGVFHGDLGLPGHEFKPGDHRTYRPEGWVRHGMEKAARMLPVAERHQLTLLQFASIWNLHPGVGRGCPPDRG